MRTGRIHKITRGNTFVADRLIGIGGNRTHYPTIETSPLTYLLAGERDSFRNDHPDSLINPMLTIIRTVTLAPAIRIEYREKMLTSPLIEKILNRAPNLKIGLLGDLFLDRYLDIDPQLDEPSIETGLTAYQVAGVRSYPGALGTVLNNLVALGVGNIVPISFVGDDGEGYELKQALQRMPSVDCSQLITTADRRTPTYCKPMRGGVELNRLDIKNRTPTANWLVDALCEKVLQTVSGFDALLVLDQVSEADCGVVTAVMRETINHHSAFENMFVLADSRERIHEFQNICIKPNEREASQLSPDRVKAIFATCGEKGIQLTLRGAQAVETIPGYPVNGPVDICGAGDSCSAGIATAVAAGVNYSQAAAFGNLVASITVQQIGTTGTASPEQVRERWNKVSKSIP